MSVQQEQKFLNIKKRLDTLHYCQPLGLESVALVERLLADLIKTTEGFQNLKKNNSELLSNQEKSEKLLHPLKQENKKLLIENNELHQEMIKVKEDCDYLQQKWDTHLKIFEGEKKDLLFLIKQKEATMQKYEKNISSNNEQSDNKQEWAETLRQADERYFLYYEMFNQKKFDQLKAVHDQKLIEMAYMNDQMNNLKNQILNRDSEIVRLTNKVNYEQVDVEKLSNEYNFKEICEKNQRLDDQITFLSKENYKFEEKIKEQNSLLNRSSGLRSENSKLETKVYDLNLQIEELNNKIERQRNEQKHQLHEEKQKQTQLMKKNDELQNKLDQNQLEMSSLNQKLEEITSSNLKLKDQEDIKDNLVSAYQSDKKAFTQQVEQMKYDRESYKKQLLALEQLSLDKDKLINDLNDRFNLNQSEIQNLKRNIENDSKSQRETQKQMNSLQNEFQLTQKQLLDLERENLSLSNQNNMMKVDIERITQLKSHLENTLEKQKSEMQLFRVESDSAQLNKQRLSTLYDGVTKDLEFVKKDLSTMEQLYNDAKENSSKNEIKCLEQFQQIKLQQELNQNLKTEVQSSQDEINKLQQQIRDFEQKLNQQNRDLAQNEQYSTMYHVQLEKNQSLNDEILKDSLEMSNLRKNIANQENQILDLKSKLRLAQEKLFTEEEKFNSNQNLVIKLNGEILDLNLKLKKASYKDQEIQQLETDLCVSRENEKKVIKQLESLQQQQMSNTSRITAEQKNIEIKEKEKSALVQEIKDLQDQLSKSNSLSKDQKIEIIKISEQSTRQKGELLDLEQKLEQKEQVLDQIKENLRQEKLSNQKQSNEIHQLKEQLEQLKHLIQSQERTQKDLLNSLNKFTNEKKNQESLQSETESENVNLRQKLKELEQSLSNKDYAVKDLDLIRDKVQHSLDEKCVENIGLQKLNREYEIKIREQSIQIEELHRKQDITLERIRNLEQEIQLTNKKDLQNKSLLEEQNMIMTSRDQTIRQLQNELQFSTRQNAQLNEQLMHVNFENGQLKQLSNQNNSQVQEIQKLAQEKLQESQSALKQREFIVKQLQKTESDLNELQSINQSLQNQVKDHEQTIQFLKNQIDKAESSDKQTFQELDLSQRQAVVLAQKLENSQKTQNNQFMQIKELQRDIDGFQRLNQNMDKSLREAQQVEIKLQNDKVHLQELNNELKLELQALRYQHEQSQIYQNKLELLLQDNRYKQSQLEYQIEKLSQQSQLSDLSQNDQSVGDINRSGGSSISKIIKRSDDYRQKINQMAQSSRDFKEKLLNIQKDFHKDNYSQK